MDRAADSISDATTTDRFVSSEGPDVAGSILDLGVARYGLVANLAVLRTASEVSSELGRMLG